MHIEWMTTYKSSDNECSQPIEIALWIWFYSNENMLFLYIHIVRIKGFIIVQSKQIERKKLNDKNGDWVKKQIAIVVCKFDSLLH